MEQCLSETFQEASQKIFSSFCARKTQWLEKKAIAETSQKGVHMALVRKIQDEKAVLQERLASALQRESFWRERSEAVTAYLGHKRTTAQLTFSAPTSVFRCFQALQTNRRLGS